jgi:hypothetical protein
MNKLKFLTNFLIVLILFSNLYSLNWFAYFYFRVKLLYFIFNVPDIRISFFLQLISLMSFLICFRKINDVFFIAITIISFLIFIINSFIFYILV